MQEQTRFVMLLKALAVCVVLVAALSVRDLAQAIGVSIPGLPLSSYAGSGMDNLLAVVLVVAAAWALRPRGAPRDPVRLLGLGAPGWRAPCLVLLSTVPFWLSSAWSGTVQPSIDWHGLLFTAVLFPFAEEVVFRGFGFVFARRSLGWRLLPPCLVQALCFGAIHWLGLRGSDEAVTVFVMTFLGAIVFALLDALNRYTIWSGLVFHCSLNAAWGVFDLSGASGGWDWINNLLRLACAAAAVMLLWRCREARQEPSKPVAAEAA